MVMIISEQNMLSMYHCIQHHNYRLGLIACVMNNYWITTENCTEGGLAVRIYMVGTLALIGINLILLVALVNRSAQGSITDTHARRHVSPLLVCK